MVALNLDSRRLPSRLSYVEDMANSLRAKRDAPPAGKRWAHNFIKRQPELKTRPFRRCFKTHISKTEFFSAFDAAHQAAIAETNIKEGFRGAGLALFDPENAISKLDVQLQTAMPPVEVTMPSTAWTARTPKTVPEAQSHSKYLQRRIRNHRSSSPESIIEAMRHFEKATTVIMHEMVLLQYRKEFDNLNKGIRQ
ncbi:hypothetical protein CFIMG_007601RA00001 [Ceratocystis fimbriata CBS 114723]|uniref:HTH CENPB-type domain-containing protein n=1 Tax=Ceratocystis fimbriata CBS 114723 TaxID=1035309 RepID=A0A2C5WVX4_9PEZI|nr:hypothetical protein CFIMG_007601RA00001 [Ceratocystis fimbriata CBS 114723]